MTCSGWIVATVAVGALVSAGWARPDIEFVTIGAPGNPGNPLESPPGYFNALGRGAVNYEYRIGKYEVTTAQWMEFVNTYSTLGYEWRFFAVPFSWGAGWDPTYWGPGRRYRLSTQPGAAMWPVMGISWREAAMFCNWLHNNKASGVWAMENGAYDISTFTTTYPTRVFSDQRMHHAGARYWIPTLDEHIKAAHYDPNRYGPGQGGYWMFSHRSDEPPIFGPPGEGQCNAGNLPAPGRIPLGSYPDVRSPWGLLDTAGATSEYTEAWWPPAQPVDRLARGSNVWSGVDPFDRIYWVEAWPPDLGFLGCGLRVAAAVPPPSTTGGAQRVAPR